MFNHLLCISGAKPTILRLKTDAVPHIFPWQAKESESARARHARGEKRKLQELERDAAAEFVAAHETVDSSDDPGGFFKTKFHIVTLNSYFILLFVTSKF